ncbi:MAG: hypothetical protein AAFQ41_05430 [Cyanobacteria bacterium J06623_7]
MPNKEKISVSWSFDEGTAEHRLFEYLNQDKGARKSNILRALMTYFSPEIALENPAALKDASFKLELDKSRVGLKKRIEYFEELKVFSPDTVSNEDDTVTDNNDEGERDDLDDEYDARDNIGLDSI